MKKTELVQFKEEYESAVRNVDEIINNPYTAILLKYKKAEESNYCIKFRQYALRYWGQLHGVDFSEFGDKDITVDEFNHALSMAQIEKKTDFEGGGGNAENNIIDQIKRRLNVILFGVVKPEDDRKIKIGKDAMLSASNIVFFDELLKIDVRDLQKIIDDSRTYSISENPYYKDSVAQYVEAINTIYGEDATQTVTETTLEQALKDSDVSRLFVEKLLKLQGEDVMTNSDFYRMDVKTDTGIVKTLFTMESERQYLEVSSQPKNRIGENEEIQFYYGGMKENKPSGNGALFSYSTEDGLSLQYVGKFKGGKIDGKGVLFAYDGLVHYLVQTGNYEKNMATGKLTTYYSNDCQSVGSFYLYKLWEYIDEKSEKWSDDELEQQIDRLLPKKKVIKLIATVSLYESPSAIVDFNQRVLIPHIGYEGEMKKASKDGKGKLYASAGWLAYDGEWKNDKYNGKGTLYNQDGTIRKKGTFDHEEELIYSNLAMAAILALDKVSLDELFTVDDSDANAATQTASAESSSTAKSIPSEAIPSEVLGCEEDGTWQKILVEATGSNATLTLWTYRDGQWEKDLSTTAAIGANGLTTDKTEGDHKTPEGTFPICFAFSTKEKNTMLYSKIIKEDSVWVCDPESIYYNTLQSKNNPQKDWADKGGAENMYVKFSKGSSNACICFGFNGDGESAYSATPYAGSALFIDGVGENGNMNSGYGDIKISGKDMTKLLSYLCANDNPVITIKSAQ